MALEAGEFIRRFLLNGLSDGFQRICHYGFLGNRYRHAKLAFYRQLLGPASPPSPQRTTPIIAIVQLIFSPPVAPEAFFPLVLSVASAHPKNPLHHGEPQLLRRAASVGGRQTEVLS